MVNGAHREVSEGDFKYSPEGLHEYLRNFPRGSIHHDTPKALSHIGPVLVLATGACAAANTAHAPGGKKLLAKRQALRPPSSIIQNGASSLT